MQKPQGILLLNLGTPETLEHSSIRSYLREFLMDERVNDLAYIPRKLLVEGVIVPFRTPASAKNYAKVWLKEGSPLRVYTMQIAHRLQSMVGESAMVRMAMRYGTPSVDQALQDFERAQISDVTVVPLFPQSSGAASASAIAHTYKRMAARNNVMDARVVPPFFDHPDFVSAWASIIQPHLSQKPQSRLLFTFHSVPVRHIQAADTFGQCKIDAQCCAAKTPPFCYRAQCLATAREIAAKLGIPKDQWSVSFQSRFGTSKWLGPATDSEIKRLGAEKTQSLIVASPSFVVDCLETIEELGIRGREDFLHSGGGDYQLTACLQDSDDFMKCLAKLVRPT